MIKRQSFGSFGEKLGALIKARNYNVLTVAVAIGVSRRAVNYWLRNDTVPRNDKIVQRIAEFFHVPESYFFGEGEVLASSDILARLTDIEARLSILEKMCQKEIEKIKGEKNEDC